MNREELAWGIAVFGVALELFIATLDWWFEIPHLVYEVGSGFRVIKSH